jgi:hypothetical protein
MDPFEADEAVFWYYCCYQYKKLSYSSMKGYLAAIRAVYLDSGYENPFKGMHRLERLLTGYKKTKQPKRRKKRLPVTVELLGRMKTQFDFSKKSDVVLWAILVVGVYGLLRLGEITGQSSNGKPRSHTVKRVPVKKCHVTWISDTHFKLFLPASKADLFNKGVTVEYFANGSDTCPVEAMSKILPRNAPKDESPLFVHRGSQAWNRKSVVEGLRSKLKEAGENEGDYSGHSLRRGGAQTLYEAGVAQWIIQAKGRWKSWCFKLYLDMGRKSDLMRGISQKMGQN